MAKEKRATWWKMFYHQRYGIESVSDADAGAGLKAAFRYFDGEDISKDDLLTQGSFTVFSIIAPHIDEAIKDYNASVEHGTKGSNTRWHHNYPPL